MFKVRPLYLKIYKNRVVVCCPETEVCIEKKGLFSNQRLAIANFEIAHQVIQEAIDELFPKGNSLFKSKNFSTIVQQLELTEGGLADIEKRLLIDLCEHSNSKQVELAEIKRELSFKEVLERFKML